jgi:hypothetical protein
MDVQEVRAAALARVQARQRPPEFKTTGRNPDGGDIRMQVAGGPGEYLGPASVGEWLDDRIARTPGHLGPWVPVLYEIAGAARYGEASAAAAVGAAGQLAEWDQFRLYVTLQDWRARTVPAAESLMREIVLEWRRRGLLTSQPDEPEQVAVVDVNAADLEAAEARRRASRGW